MDTNTDKLKFRTSVKEKPETRRGILSTISSVYDPLGFVSPFILAPKILLQDLCRLGLGWDDEIPESFLLKWHSWLKELPQLDNVTIDRCIKPPNFGEPISNQLHHFSDASESGYGAVSYLRQENSKGDIHCSFLMSNSRITPLKHVTIPRLELSAATVSVRLDKMLRTELTIPIESSVFWTDSTSVLKYVTNTSTRFRTFVANRISVIRDISDPSQWRHVRSELNPGDDASRGLSAISLLNDHRWLLGPEFLWKHDSEWPESPSLNPLEDTDPEIKRDKTSCAVVVTERKSVCDLFENFSSWHRLKKFFSWMLKFKCNLQKASKNQNKFSKKDTFSLNPVSVEEMRMSEIEILKCVQNQQFSAEINMLLQNKKISKSSHLVKLDPILIASLIRVGGRLQNAPIPDDAKHQIILSNASHVTSLIIQHYHALSGTNHVLSMVRTKFWILKGSSTVRKTLLHCTQCRFWRSPTVEQKMANLPDDRIAPCEPPFTKVGTDYFGPIYVKRGRSTVKRYGCIFTCLAMRAVHIEVANSLDTSSFINALRRFIACRGQPTEIRSDNGTNFQGAEKELREEIAKWNQQSIREFLLQKEIKWIFNPPAASHHGGVWERCIRTIRKIMNTTVKQQTLDDEGLATLLCEIENVINGRPLTKITDDPRDLNAITPNHLLLLRQDSNTLPPGIFNQRETYSVKRWKQVQYLADQFWGRWIKEYLPLLQERQKWHNLTNNLSVGDLVLVVDQNLHRGKWPKGIIEEVYPDNDGIVRQVLVRTTSGKVRRDVRNICVLEGTCIP